MEQKINLDRLEQAEALFGSFDENVRLIEKEFGVALVVRDSELKITGDDPEAVDKATRTVQSLLTLIGSGENLTEQNVRYCIRMVGEDSEDKVARLAGDVICITSKGKPIKPKTVGQRTYCDNIKDNTITIGVGPAGTGGQRLPGPTGEPDYPHPPGGGGWGEAGLPPRGLAAEGGPLPAPPVRRPL